MRWPQFSLVALGAAVALCAVACAALTYASSFWSICLTSLAIVFLAFATLAAVYRAGEHRAFWVGCAFCGWLYLLLVFGPLPQRGQASLGSELITTHLAYWMFDHIFARDSAPTVGMAEDAGTMFDPFAAPVQAYPDLNNFLRVSHALWTWIITFAGGVIARWLYRSASPSNVGT